MTDAEWGTLRHFRKDEAWGDTGSMDYSFLRVLDAFREMASTQCVVTSGNGGEHKPNSLHYRGCAVDIVFPWSFFGIPSGTQGSQHLMNLFFVAVKFPFTGIGVYPEWEYKGTRMGGMHLEKDPMVDLNIVTRKFWVGVGTNAMNTQYLALSQTVLNRYL